MLAIVFQLALQCAQNVTEHFKVELYLDAQNVTPISTLQMEFVEVHF